MTIELAYSMMTMQWNIVISRIFYSVLVVSYVRGEGAEIMIAEQEQPEEKRTVYSSLPSLGISRELSRVKSSFFLSQANTLVDQDEREER